MVDLFKISRWEVPGRKNPASAWLAHLVVALSPILTTISPNIHTKILLTDLHTYLLSTSWENLLKNQSNFSLVIILLVLVIAWGRVKLRINITRVFRNYRNCPSRAATRAISAISENTSDIYP